MWIVEGSVEVQNPFTHPPLPLSPIYRGTEFGGRVSMVGRCVGAYGGPRGGGVFSHARCI